MIDRITKNEDRLDKITKSIHELENALNNFENIKKDLVLLNKYYGSKNWFKDKDAYENNLIPKIKAGVLSEDAVWNTFSSIDEIIIDMKRIIANYERNK